MSITELEGATTAPPENAMVSNAGEFAARWNERTPEQREQAASRFIEAQQEAMRCFQQDHAGYIAYLEQRLKEARQETLEPIREHVKNWSRTRFKRLFALLVGGEEQ